MNDPIAVLLKFAFIAVLYLFLLWVARSSLKDLGRPPLGTGMKRDRPSQEPMAAAPILVAERGGGLDSGMSFAIDGVTTIGRSPRADITVEDSFASGNHARIYERDGYFYLEDMNSTNGTYLNGRRVGAQELLQPEDRIGIGDTELRYAQQ